MNCLQTLAQCTDFFAISFGMTYHPSSLGRDVWHPARAHGNSMNAPMELSHEDVLRVKLAALKREHRDLDDAITAMQERGTSDQLAMVRLKKKKLGLKDQIARIEDELTPDIIA